ncbi:methyltransferase domain-containing protein [Streptomyces sp. NPDC058301]|uniref:methyltransferase domain-containing protein n=1 Tax=Streptomyces sp. NPDC058301 TaxID=3346436 RepID=UPI0036E08099
MTDTAPPAPVPQPAAAQPPDAALAAAVLARHPEVAQVSVVPGGADARDGAAPTPATALVVPRLDRDRARQELRLLWNAVADSTAAGAPALGTDFDTSGWTSSYTGAPLPEPEMREWVAHSVALLREAEPATVLELGCGTGLLLLRIAPDTRRYVALDLSRPILDGLAVAVGRAGLSQVELHQGEATGAERFAGAGFDLVVCNSVVHYFPDEEYLRTTVAAAVRAAGPGGRAVVGDVRDHSLAKAFHASVVLAQAEGGATGDALRQAWRRRLREDPQMSVAPQWFTALAAGDGEVSWAEVRPRRGAARNEMNGFRFDAVLHREARLLDIDDWREWSTASLTTDAVDRLLSGRPRALGLLGIPNARTAGAAAVATALAGPDIPSVTELRRLSRSHDGAGVDPEALFALAARRGYRCHLSRARGAADGSFDAAFLPEGDGVQGLLPRFPRSPGGPAGQQVTEPVVQRALGLARKRLVPRLRALAEAELAPAQRPERYEVVPELP